MLRTLLLLFFVCFLSGTSAAEGWKLNEPGMPVIGQTGEEVLVRLEGPQGKAPVLALGSQRFALTESLKGTYSGMFRVGSRSQDLGLIVEGERISLGEVAQDTNARYFEALKESVTRQGPLSDYDRLTPLYPGTRIRLDGSRGGWHRAAGSQTWVDARGGEVKEGFLPPNRLNRVIVTQANNGDALLAFRCDRPGEVQVQHSVADGTLRVTLEDTLQTCFDIKRPTGVAEFLGPILLRPLPGAVGVELSAKEIVGYQLAPRKEKNEVVLRLRKPLPKSLKGLRVAVDAGHGGPEDPGTVGHGGLAEKTLNLRVAKALAARLEAMGAIVTMTRTTDSDVASQADNDAGELQARVDRSIQAGSQLFLSVHHNARPSIEQGKIYHGTDIYWYQPQSQALGHSLADPIADAIGEETRSYRWRSFYVIRQTHSPSVLIEFQYLSNPVLEKTVLNQPDYPDKAALGVVEGLQEYLQGPQAQPETTSVKE
jgi:N-acetylmuramoyl-L-alanine amidase